MDDFDDFDNVAAQYGFATRSSPRVPPAFQAVDDHQDRLHVTHRVARLRRWCSLTHHQGPKPGFVPRLLAGG
jgi:hypothetical protein